MEPGWFGTVETITERFFGLLEPHELLAVTEIVPPLEPTVTGIDSVVELPLHPEGKVHVYEVAPDTDAIL
jgi:hypothetical protein